MKSAEIRKIIQLWEVLNDFNQDETDMAFGYYNTDSRSIQVYKEKLKEEKQKKKKIRKRKTRRRKKVTKKR